MRDDVAMMRKPDTWPAWPWLPLKRHTKTGDVEFGLLWEAKGYKTTVFLACLYHLTPSVRTFLTTQPKLEYKSFEDIVADGWVID